MDQDITAPIGRYFHPTPIRSVVVRAGSEHGSTTLDLVSPSTSSTTIMMSPEEEEEEEGDDTKKEKEEGGKEVVAVILAAQFRGRGLLCIADSQKSTTSTTVTPSPLSELPHDIMGVVFSSSLSSAPSSSSSSSFGDGKNTMTNNTTVSLRPIETFRSLCTWSHEHDPRKVMCERLLNDGCSGGHHGDDCIGLSAALSWRDLAHEIHDPIPI
jgi:hypothetical protein